MPPKRSKSSGKKGTAAAVQQKAKGKAASTNGTAQPQDTATAVQGSPAATVVPQPRLPPEEKFDLILTDTVQQNLDDLRLALEHRSCILLRGAVGCGKTSIAMAAAKQLGTEETMIRISLDDTFDSKDLLGKFSASSTPGAFEWRPGPLVIAVEEGRWLLMEDLDLASFDVLTALAPLLAEGKLFIPEQNRFVEAAPGFKLIATQQCVQGANGTLFPAKHGAQLPNIDLWSSVAVYEPTLDELQEIVQRRYSGIPLSILTEMIANLKRPTAIEVSSAASPQSPVGSPTRKEQFLRQLGGSAVFVAAPLTMRDVLKWARRVVAHCPPSLNPAAQQRQGEEFIASQRREAIFREAVDAFCSRYPSSPQKEAVVLGVAAACGVPAETALSMTQEYKPQLNSAHNMLSIGRTTLQTLHSDTDAPSAGKQLFAPTKVSLVLMEQLATAVSLNEPVLLTGETGVGKTFIVQQLANLLNQKLVVHNVNQQSDSSDFMGGWKPQDLGKKVTPVYLAFLELFTSVFDAEKNAEFLGKLQAAYGRRSWELVLRSILVGTEKAKRKISKQRAQQQQEGGGGPEGGIETSDPASPTTTGILQHENQWMAVAAEAERLHSFAKSNAAMFEFEEGSLIRAWKEGWWLLLDEVNLATTEVLERVAAVVGESQHLFVTERGDTEPIPRHANFRIFANMNPPTDVGKKDLPPALRSKFTEFYVEEPFSDHDLSIVVNAYIGQLAAAPPVQEIVKFFQECIKNARTTLSEPDGESRPPHFSLRTLTRALSYVRSATPIYGFRVALFDGLQMGFGTPIARKFQPVVESMLMKTVFHRDPSVVKPTLPKKPIDKEHVALEHLWLEQGPLEPLEDQKFILTKSVCGHMRNLARAVASKRPVLLEGPTSSGKSSLVKYLAERTGHEFVRINNHESTEVQEYLGHYVSDENGKLRFVDGVLVKAVREGHWVVLDELNLAPTEVLEALNRLLDDNAELYIPDTQEVIKAHPHLRVFATQNPSGLYGGRKTLSRAFRNRFLEIIVDDMPTEELKEVLAKRYDLAPSFAEKMVGVMVQLQQRRQSSQLFAGRHGFITPRDLFRWAERCPRTYDELAMHGVLLLGDRCRKLEERQIVKDTIEKVMKVDIDDKKMYDPLAWTFTKDFVALLETELLGDFHLVWTPSMKRLFTVTGLCLQHKEPVLLVGETGASKTTICQVWARLLQVGLQIVNCHQHSEAADFLGALRPNAPELRHLALFTWFDGPLVRCMKDGSMFVLDEISLAEDSVLERLNSVLEPSRQLTLAEKSDAEIVNAVEAFRVLATMNPSGDFGKKELSPALRNRFTEVYVQPVREVDEVSLILRQRMPTSLSEFAPKLAQLLHHTISIAGFHHVSIRDIVALSDFMKVTEGRCKPNVAFIHGIDAVLLDGSGVGAGQSEISIRRLKEACLTLAAKLTEQVPEAVAQVLAQPFWELYEGVEKPQVPAHGKYKYSFDAKTTERNVSKILRALVMPKPVLLEGSPGVGKTSVVETLGAALGKTVDRINLSDQTDMMDLLGAFLPCADGFQWSDGILLRAVKEGHWVILDELNLANQTVLEGLNALLDHRGSIFLPEICQEVQAGPGFRIFGAQNPIAEGGGRKGLPRSFLNRFSRVHVEPFEREDLHQIAAALCPDFEQGDVAKMVTYVSELHIATATRRVFGLRGGPYEFNLRDALRWAALMRLQKKSVCGDAGDGAETNNIHVDPATVLDLLFLSRFRTHADRQAALALYEEVFGTKVKAFRPCTLLADSNSLVYADGYPVIQRRPSAPLGSTHGLLLLPSQSNIIAGLLRCVAAHQFAFLVGPQGSGKTSVLRCAAYLAGQHLVEIPMTAGCDTVDLLGGFDQEEGKPGTFAWKDSSLVQAIIDGHWAVLDNANFCNASVLDRLNPLVEPNGVLVMNEQGLVDGEVRIIKPHPDFRLFLIGDPRFGEVSRAMRNRAVEIFVPPLGFEHSDTAAIGALSSVLHPTATAQAQPMSIDSISSLAKFHGEYIKTMHNLHLRAGAKGLDIREFAPLSEALAAGAPSLRTFLYTASMLQTQLKGEQSSAAAVSRAIKHHYLRNRVGAVPSSQQAETITALLTAAELSFAHAVGETPSTTLTSSATASSTATVGAEAVRRAVTLVAPALELDTLEVALTDLFIARMTLPFTTMEKHEEGEGVVEKLAKTVHLMQAIMAVLALPVGTLSTLGGQQSIVYRAQEQLQALAAQYGIHWSLDMSMIASFLQSKSVSAARITNPPLVAAQLIPVLYASLVEPLLGSCSAYGGGATEGSTIHVSNSPTLNDGFQRICQVLHQLLITTSVASTNLTPALIFLLHNVSAFLRPLTASQGAWTLTQSNFIQFAVAMSHLHDSLMKLGAHLASYQQQQHDKHQDGEGDDMPLEENNTNDTAGMEEMKSLCDTLLTMLKELSVEVQRYLMLSSSDLLAPLQLWSAAHPLPLTVHQVDLWKALDEAQAEFSEAERFMQSLWSRSQSVQGLELVASTQQLLLDLKGGQKGASSFDNISRELAFLSSQYRSGSSSTKPRNCFFPSERELFVLAQQRLSVLKKQMEKTNTTTSSTSSSMTKEFHQLQDVLPHLLISSLRRSKKLAPLFDHGSWMPAAIAATRRIASVTLQEFSTAASPTSTETVDQLVAMKLSTFLANYFTPSSTHTMDIDGLRIDDIAPLLRLIVHNDLNAILSVYGIQLAALLQESHRTVRAEQLAAVEEKQFALAIPVLEKVLEELSAPEDTDTQSADAGHQQNRAQSIAELLLTYGLWKCQVHCPATLIDPMHKRQEHIATLESAQKYWSEGREVLRHNDAITRSGDQSESAAVVDSVLRRAEKRITHETAQLVPRPDTTGNKFYELTKLMQDTCSQQGFCGAARVATMIALLESLANASSSVESIEATAEQFASFADALAQTESEVRNNYVGYEDFAVPFGEGLGFMSLGSLVASMVASHHSTAQQHRTTGTGTATSLELLQFPSIIPRIANTGHAALQYAHEIFPKMQALDASLDTICANKAWAFHHKQPVLRVFAQYRALFREIERLREEEDTAERTQILYREKAQTIAGDDERALKRMRELFPNYASSFETNVKVPMEGEEEDDDEEETAEGNASAATELRGARHARLLLLEAHAKRLRRLVDTHREFFAHCTALYWGKRRGHRLQGELICTSTSALSKHVASFSAFFQAGIAAIHGQSKTDGTTLQRTQHQLTSAQECGLAGAFAANSSAIASEMTQLTKAPLSDDITLKVSDGFNIYLDSEPVEAVHATGTLGSLLSAVHNSPFFAENHVLQKIAMLVQQVLSLPLHSTPLMKILTGLELIVKECYEWERDAARHVSLIQHIQQLSKWVLRWRRLELHCWDHLFVAKDNALKGQAAANWFHLHDVIAGVAATRTVDLSEVFSLLHAILWKSSVGEFGHRVEVLRSFGLQAETEWHLVTGGLTHHLSHADQEKFLSHPLKQLANLLMNTAEFFSQFNSLVSVCKANVVDPLAKQLNDFCTAMTWQDATFHALQASTEKSHLQVCRVLARLDEGMVTPFNAVVTNEEKRCDEDPAMGVTRDVKTKKQEEKEEARRRKKEEMEKKMKKRLRKTKPGASANESEQQQAAEPPQLWNCPVMVSSTEFLSELADEVLVQVSGLQQPKTPQNQKTRALKLLFDTAEKAGLPLSVEKNPSPWCQVFATLPPHLSPFSETEGPTATFFRASHQLQRMREQSEFHHNDLSTAQVRRALAMSEGLYDHAQQQRVLLDSVTSLLQDVEILHEHVSAIEPTVTSKTVDCGSVCVSAVPELLSAIAVFCSESRAITANHATILSAITEIELAVSTAAQCLNGKPRSSLLVVSVGFLSQLHAALKDVLRTLDTLLEAAFSLPAVVAAGQVLLEKLSATINKALAEEGTAAADDEEKQQQSRRKKKQRTEPSHDEADQWRQSAHDRLKLLESLLAEFQQRRPTVLPPSEETTKEGEEDDELSAIARPNVYAEGKIVFGAMADKVDSLSLRPLIATAGPRRLDASTRQLMLSRLSHCLSALFLMLQQVETLHKETSYACFILSRLFATLFKKGFCKTEDDENKDDDGEGGDGQQQQGTGMDDGEGEKDVTDQIENEDQLMNQKDLEEQQEQNEKDNQQGDEEDKAKEVETNFEGQKENMEDNPEEGEEDEEGGDTDMEEGSVNEDDKPSRKKQRTEQNDPNMDEDEGGDAEDVPDDEFDQREEGEDEETANYGNKEQEIKDAGNESDDDNDEKKKEHELIGLENDAEMAEDADDEEGQERPSEARDSDAESEGEDLPSEDEGDRPDEAGVDDRLSTNEEEPPQENPDEEGEGGKPDDGQEDQEGEGDSGDEPEKKDDDAYDKDQNIHDGGQQDDKTGEEATERQEKKMEDKPDDAAGGEEQQSGEQQDVSDTGRQWKQKRGDDQTQRRDTQRQQQRSQQAPKTTMQQAVQRRDWRKVQSLNLEKSVKLKDDEAEEEAKKAEDEKEVEMSSGDEFELDEQGEKQGLLATEKQHVTEAEQKELDRGAGSDNEEPEDESKKEEDEKADAPKDQATRRKTRADEVKEEEEEEDEKKKQKKRRGGRLTVKQEEAEEESQGESEAEEEDIEDLDEKQRRGREQWIQHEAATQHLAQQLCEQLRLIMDPTVADKLQGDYKTGKRINIKKIIPYIASQYKKDRIWLRRAKASKRAYQVLVALDDSLSMRNNHAGDMSLQAVALMSKALQQLDVGEFALLSFGKETKIVHPLDQPFIHDSGPRAFSEIAFDQSSTNMRNFLNTTLDYMDASRARSASQSRSTTQQLMQICFVITDGQLTENRAELRKLVARAESNKQVVVLIILDVKANANAPTQEESSVAAVDTTGGTTKSGLTTAAALRERKQDREARLQQGKSANKGSVVDMQTIEFVGQKVVKKAYLDEFPFSFYLIVRELQTLPEVLADAMRQWFELMTHTTM